jgi:hypothetical protein
VLAEAAVRVRSHPGLGVWLDRMHCTCILFRTLTRETLPVYSRRYRRAFLEAAGGHTFLAGGPANLVEH